MSNAELSESVYALLRATRELSAAQAALDRDPELTTAPRDHAMTKVIEAFRRFETSAKASKMPLAVTIRLSSATR